jgi:hypothetical protein
MCGGSDEEAMVYLTGMEIATAPDGRIINGDPLGDPSPPAINRGAMRESIRSSPTSVSILRDKSRGEK